MSFENLGNSIPSLHTHRITQEPTYTEIERGMEGGRERERWRETDRQTDKDRRVTERQRDRQREWERLTPTDREWLGDRQRHRQRDRRRDRSRERYLEFIWDTLLKSLKRTINEAANIYHYIQDLPGRSFKPWIISFRLLWREILSSLIISPNMTIAINWLVYA